MKLLIAAKFHVFVAQGEGARATRFEYAPGMVVNSEDLPAGHTAEQWVEKDLAREVNAPMKDDPPPESGAPAFPTP